MKTVKIEIRPVSLLVGAVLGATALSLAAAQSPIVAQTTLTLTAQQREILSHMSIVQLDDGSGNDCKTIQISGVNVRLVNGIGVTASQNCLGNLIVGYNEPGFGADDRSGSHNVVVGTGHSYSSHGGLVVGERNTISAPHASVCGGLENQATGTHSSVTGGSENIASGRYAWVGGGGSNFSVPEGQGGPEGIGGNIASGDWSAVAGGSGNEAAGAYAAVSGGALNDADGEGSSVQGGQSNQATHVYAVVSGGCSQSTVESCDHQP